MSAARPFEFAGRILEPGSCCQVNLETAKLYDNTPMQIPIRVTHGLKPGPVLFVSAVIHGDEILGVETIRRFLASPQLDKLRGTLIVVPIVNVFGYTTCTRYMPDRRDLNRCFPGSKNGSLTSQLAYQFMKLVVEKSDFGIDLHTAAEHRSNFPQVRANLEDPKVLELARAFGAPVIIDSRERDGSLRQSANDCDVPVLLYEGGTALSYDTALAKQAAQGILRVMEYLEMLPASHEPCPTPHICRSSSWVRAPVSGAMITALPLGHVVEKDSLLAKIYAPFGECRAEIRSPCRGVIIGSRVLPLVHTGDAIFHIASLETTHHKHGEKLIATDEADSDGIEGNQFDG